jgi:hypothetical protein
MADIEVTRRFLQKMVRRGEKITPDFDFAMDVVHQIDDICEHGESLLQSGDAQAALAFLWLVADEFVPNYEILEEDCQVAEGLETWAETTAGVIDSMRLSPDDRQKLQPQIKSWSGIFVDFGDDNPLQALIDAIGAGESE